MNRTETITYNVPYVDEVIMGQMEAVYPGIVDTYGISVVDTEYDAKRVATEIYIREGRAASQGMPIFVYAERHDNYWEVTVNAEVNTWD